MYIVTCKVSKKLITIFIDLIFLQIENNCCRNDFANLKSLTSCICNLKNYAVIISLKFKLNLKMLGIEMILQI